MPTAKRKQVIFTPLEVRSVTEDGSFEGYASVFDAVDAYNTRFIKGCFDKSIKEQRGVVPILDEHGAEIGLTSALSETEYGLFVRGDLHISPDPQEQVLAARERYVRMKRRQEKGADQPMSFGFIPHRDRIDEEGVVEFTEVALTEVSLVRMPAQPLASVLNVRSVNYSRLEHSLSTVAEAEIAQAFDALDDDLQAHVISRADPPYLTVLDRLHVSDSRALEPLLHSLESRAIDVSGFGVMSRGGNDIITLDVSGLENMFDTLTRSLPYTHDADKPFIEIAKVSAGQGQNIANALPPLAFRNLPFDAITWVSSDESNRVNVTLQPPEQPPEQAAEPSQDAPAEPETPRESADSAPTRASSDSAPQVPDTPTDSPPQDAVGEADTPTPQTAPAQASDAATPDASLEDVRAQLAELTSAMNAFVDEMRGAAHAASTRDSSSGHAAPDATELEPQAPAPPVSQNQDAWAEMRALLERAETQSLSDQLYDQLTNV